MKKKATKKTTKKKTKKTPKKSLTIKVNASFEELMNLAANTPIKKKK